MPTLLAGCRAATAPLAQMHVCDVKLCADLSRARPTLTLATACSSTATSSANAIITVACHYAASAARKPHSTRGTTACHFPRFHSLKAFGRRPRCNPHRRNRPASETLINRVRDGRGPTLARVRYPSKTKPKLRKTAVCEGRASPPPVLLRLALHRRTRRVLHLEPVG
jgi:hypothetical protein